MVSIYPQREKSTNTFEEEKNTTNGRGKKKKTGSCHFLHEETELICPIT